MSGHGKTFYAGDNQVGLKCAKCGESINLDDGVWYRYDGNARTIEHTRCEDAKIAAAPDPMMSRYLELKNKNAA